MVFAFDLLAREKPLGEQPADHCGHGGAGFAGVVSHAAGHFADGDRPMILRDLQDFEFGLTEIGGDARHGDFY